MDTKTSIEYELSKTLLSKVIAFDQEKFDKYFIKRLFNESTNENGYYIGDPTSITKFFIISHSVVRLSIQYNNSLLISSNNSITSIDDELYILFLNAIKVLQKFIFIRETQRQSTNLDGLIELSKEL